MNKYYKTTHNEKEQGFLITETLLAVGAAPTSFCKEMGSANFLYRVPERCANGSVKSNNH